MCAFHRPSGYLFVHIRTGTQAEIIPQPLWSAESVELSNQMSGSGTIQYTPYRWNEGLHDTKYITK
jgi:hypothetical protein